MQCNALKVRGAHMIHQSIVSGGGGAEQHHGGAEGGETGSAG